MLWHEWHEAFKSGKPCITAAPGVDTSVYVTGVLHMECNHALNRRALSVQCAL